MATLIVILEVQCISTENNTIPILTTKKVATKTCFKELLWFIQGHTNNELLKEQGVRIWDDNASKRISGITQFKL